MRSSADARGLGEDAIVRSEAPLEHRRERLQRGGVFVDEEQDRLGHGTLL